MSSNYFPDHVYQLDKALYGLKQAPRAWYDHLTELLQDRGFEIGKIDPALFTKKVKGELFVCQLYVDDIIFGSPNKASNEEFAALMTSKFKMSMMGELKSSFSGSKSNKEEKEPSSTKPNTLKTCSRDSS